MEARVRFPLQVHGCDMRHGVCGVCVCVCVKSSHDQLAEHAHTDTRKHCLAVHTSPLRISRSAADRVTAITFAPCLASATHTSCPIPVVCWKFCIRVGDRRSFALCSMQATVAPSAKARRQTNTTL